MELSVHLRGDTTHSLHRRQSAYEGQARRWSASGMLVKGRESGVKSKQENGGKGKKWSEKWREVRWNRTEKSYEGLEHLPM